MCPANIVLNELAQKIGFAYDRDGLLANSGSIVPALLESLNGLPYYAQSPPK